MSFGNSRFKERMMLLMKVNCWVWACISLANIESHGTLHCKRDREVYYLASLGEVEKRQMG
jgi:hypothetical protein